VWSLCLGEQASEDKQNDHPAMIAQFCCHLCEFRYKWLFQPFASKTEDGEREHPNQSESIVFTALGYSGRGKLSPVANFFKPTIGLPALAVAYAHHIKLLIEHVSSKLCRGIILRMRCKFASKCET